MSLVTRSERRVRKHVRVRKKVAGTAAKPRLNVYRSSKHIYAQLVDDDKGATLHIGFFLVPPDPAELLNSSPIDIGEGVAVTITAVGHENNFGGILHFGLVVAPETGQMAT